jgi:hypothetical protein
MHVPHIRTTLYVVNTGVGSLSGCHRTRVDHRDAVAQSETPQHLFTEVLVVKSGLKLIKRSAPLCQTAGSGL